MFYGENKFLGQFEITLVQGLRDFVFHVIEIKEMFQMKSVIKFFLRRFKQWN